MYEEIHCLLSKNSLLKKVLMAVMKSAPSTELPVLGLALSFNFKPRFLYTRKIKIDQIFMNSA